MKSCKIGKKNLILLTVDCLRADHLHCMGYSKDITPTLDTLAKNGIMFTKAFANAPSTHYSMPSFLSSTLPPVKKQPKITLAGILKKNGFVTAAFNPNPIVFSKIHCKIRINDGFDLYDMMLSSRKQYNLKLEFLRSLIIKYFRDRFEKNKLIDNSSYLLFNYAMKTIPNFLCTRQHLHIPSAEEINQKAITWIKNQKQRFFIWLHYMDVHEPYAPLDYNNMTEMLYLITKYRYFPDKITNKENQKLIILYDLEIKYTDNAINNFLIALKKLKNFDDCIIIVTADHGDAFNEHGVLGHGFGSEAKVYDELIHVPLIIYGLDEKNININKQVQLLDLSPTICELLNISKPINFFGENILFPIKEKMIIKSEYYIAYRTPDHKLIIPKMDNEENELYDLKRDSEEKINIYNIKQKLAAKLELEMITLLQKYKKKTEVLEIKNKLIKKASS